MYANALRPLYKKSCTILNTRHLRHHRQKILEKNKFRRENAGLDHRRQLLEKDEDIENVDFDELEADFMGLNMVHKEHMQEIETMKEQERYLIVKQKYFKESTPNFLTYNDKQQIRHLHSTDPEMWSIEKLCEGFPALPEIIRKIVKSSWTKNNEDKIKKHDASVSSNWNLFKRGKLSNLPEGLTEHLKKFTHRTTNNNLVHLPENVNKISVTVKNACGEFSEIIKSYENLKEKSMNNVTSKQKAVENFHSENKPKKETYLTSSPAEFLVKQHMTCSAAMGIKDDDNNSVSSPPPQISKDNLQSKGEIKKYDCSPVQVSKPMKDYSHLIYPEKIRISSKMRKQGSLYKLNDCYYDVDGEFLYRVPGMS